MRLSLRDANGVEVDHAVVEDSKDAVYNAMRVLARQPAFGVGSILVVDGDNVPKLEPKVQPTVTADNLVTLAGRLEARAFMLEEAQPGNAADMRIAAKLCRHAVKVWVVTSVSLVA